MIEFDEQKHEYKVNGTKVPSVTEVTRFLHYDEASGANVYLRNEAARRGSAIHEATMLIDYGEHIPDEFPDDWFGYIEAYLRFLNDFKVEWLGIERQLAFIAEDRPVYAGTIDRYGYINGEMSVLDIKTGTKINHLAVEAQLEGYQQMLYQNEKIAAQKLYTLQLCKDGTYNLFRMKQTEGIFNTCLQIHFDMKNYKGEKI